MRPTASSSGRPGFPGVVVAFDLELKEAPAEVLVRELVFGLDQIEPVSGWLESATETLAPWVEVEVKFPKRCCTSAPTCSALDRPVTRSSSLATILIRPSPSKPPSHWRAALFCFRRIHEHSDADAWLDQVAGHFADATVRHYARGG